MAKSNKNQPKKKVYVKKKKEQAPVIPIETTPEEPTEEIIPETPPEIIIEEKPEGERDDTATTHEENHQGQ